jgi:hypothetical protein
MFRGNAVVDTVYLLSKDIPVPFNSVGMHLSTNVLAPAMHNLIADILVIYIGICTSFIMVNSRTLCNVFCKYALYSFLIHFLYYLSPEFTPLVLLLQTQ